MQPSISLRSPLCNINEFSDLEDEGCLLRTECFSRASSAKIARIIDFSDLGNR